MKVIVITGSTRGIGFGLADSFLDLECKVVVTGRSSESLSGALNHLRTKFSEDQILGVICDVMVFDQIKSLWETAYTHFGGIDIWINNAGISNPQMKIWKCNPSDVNDVVDTNLLGTIYGSMVAVSGMLEQGYGSVYNMEGMGSDGRFLDGLSFYGMSKYALYYFTKALIEETKGTPLIVGSLRPGMVITDLITDQYIDRPDEFERVKKIFNIIADRVENVTPWLAGEILRNNRTGVRISYLKRWKLLGRFLVSPFYKRDLFENI
jgi:NAD(P)-dependent dehydrogenase (short-subunit alcohol dehydrogenase family)